MSAPAINPRLRRSYDLRGVVGDTLTPADAHGVGRAFAALARGSGARALAVSRDGRLSSPELETELVRGLVEGGMRVHRLPPGPTPLVSFAIRRLGLDGGVMVTGSHNPADQNGFKLHLHGHPLFGEALKQLWSADPAPASDGALVEADASAAYLDALAAELDGSAGLGVAWDSGNGATGAIVERMAERLAGRHLTLFTELDGRFPNHHPDPSVPANLAPLRTAVLSGGFDVGFAFDGDGDRIGCVDGEGEIVWADQLMLLLARDLLSDRPGAPIVADVKSSDTLFAGIAAAGGRPVMAPSGYVLIRERMLAEGAPFAGEMSGHIFFADRWHGSDDALYVAVRTLRALARSGRSLADFRRALPPNFATPELRLGCPDERKAAVLDAIAADLAASGAKVDRTDGLRVTEPDGWWLLRSSGTEPKLTGRAEANSEAALSRIESQLRERLARHGVS